MRTSLVILAAGIGSRFGGGVKQIAPVGPNGEIIIDYSIKDALDAGFDKIVFIIRRDIEKDFREAIGTRIEKLCEVEYVYQDSEDLPFIPTLSGKRTKPWGTTHALWSARNAVKEPFLVINADDYYGKSAYKTAHNFLVKAQNGEYGMVGFILRNTLSENGGVTRGICRIGDGDTLAEVVETYNIEKRGDDAVSVGKDGSEKSVDIDSVVSMNMWCFTPDIFKKAEEALVRFLQNISPDDLKSEHVLPTLVEELIEKKAASVKVLKSNDAWVGVTYKEDKPAVEAYFKKLIEDGVYPRKLF